MRFVVLTVSLALCGAACAGELPSRRAVEPATQKQKYCAQYGPGFVWAESVNSCVKVGGSVQVDQSYLRRTTR
jgi:hypothetical protein